MFTETIRFEEVKRQFTRSSPCPSCGKKVRRQRTFSQTINPFNQSGEGADRHVKSRREIWDELAETGAKWRAQAEMCSDCKAASGASSGSLAAALIAHLKNCEASQ